MPNHNRSAYFKTTLLLIAATILMFQFAHGQSFSFPAHERSEKKTATEFQLHHLPDTLTVRGDAWYDIISAPSTWYLETKLKSVNDFVKLYVDHSYKVKVKFPYTYRLAYQLIGYKDSVTMPTILSIDTLTIGYNPDSLTSFQDMQVKRFTGYNKMIIVFTDLFQIDGGTVNHILVDTITGLNFIAETSILTQFYHKKKSGADYYADAGASTMLDMDDSLNSASDYLKVKWNIPGTSPSTPFPIEPANFELEWTFVDNYKKDIYSGALTTIDAADIAYSFKNNSTRVWLSKNNYKIPLIYQKGYLIYRVRMVRPDSIDYKYPVYSQWNVDDEGVGVSSLIASHNCMYVSDAHLQDSINWQYTISFAEDGKYKHVLSYFDGLLKNRQSITRFNSTPEKLIATEQIYDFEGRPSISILPTPINSAQFRFQPNLSLNAVTGLPYKADDFDTLNTASCPLEFAPAPLDSDALANIYYSPLNPDKSGFQKFVPDAGGYPFVQTLYSPGYDDRIDRQGGAGDSLQIGFGHDTKNDYVGAESMDLYRMFGTDIGTPAFYKKTVTKDPNGQLSSSIQDYKGHQIASYMVGRGPRPDIHPVTSNSNVPDSTYKAQYLMSGYSTPFSDGKRVFDKDIYMDVTGYDTVYYNMSALNYRVCPLPTDGEYKTFVRVPLYYKYEISDQCGNLELSVSDTAGEVGVTINDNTSAYEYPRGVYLPQGKHSVHTEVSFYKEDFLAALDTMMLNPPECFKTEPYFIKKSVLKKQFPCKEKDWFDLDDCAKKKKKMIEEVSPGGKYARYKWGVDTLTGKRRLIVDDTNTIFSTDGNTPLYKDSTIVTLPDTIWYRGKWYIPKLLSIDSFILVFNDTLGEALLPLHPEYCKLQNCFEDNYENILKSFPDAKTAEKYNRFVIDSIIKYDPIYPKMTSGPLVFAHARDSLARYKGGRVGIDTLMLSTVYCNCSDELMFNECLTSIFKNDIQTLNMRNEKIKNAYYQKLLPVYFSNRERYKHMIRAAGCIGDSAKLTLIKPSVFPSIFEADGGFDLSGGGYLGSFDTSLRDKTKALWKFPFDTASVVDNQDSIIKAADSLVKIHDSLNYLASSARVDSIIKAFANCVPSGNLPRVSDTLFAIMGRVRVIAGFFTPEQIRYALEVNGISFTDLCNPLMIEYNRIGPPVTGKSSCHTDDFYSDVKNFFSGIPKNALLDLTAYDMTLSAANKFEQKLIDHFEDSTEVKVFAQHNDNLYTLFVVNKVPKAIPLPEDTVKIFLETAKSPYGTPYDLMSENIFQHTAYPANDHFFITDVSCINEVDTFPVGAGHILNYAFTLNVYKSCDTPIHIVVVAASLGAWNNTVQMTRTEENKLEDCVPCTQIKNLYKAFNDSMIAWGVNGIDHPLYGRYLRNFMNNKIHKTFNTEDYERFIESCALADSIPIKRYNGYANITFSNDADADSFIVQVSRIHNVYLETYLRYKTVDNNIHLQINMGGVPTLKLKAVIDEMATRGANVNQVFNPSSSSDFIGWLMVRKDTHFDSTALRSAVSDFTIQAAKEVGYYNVFDGSYIPFNYYQILSNTTTNSLISRGVSAVQHFMRDSAVSGMLVNFRESTVDNDYHTTDKQAYLSYVHQFGNLNNGKVLDTIREEYLQSLYPLRSPQYGMPTKPSDLSNLYVASNTGYPGLDTTWKILRKTKDFLASGSIFPAYGSARSQDVTTLPGAILYTCADQTYWYRYFGGEDTLYNIFIKMPLYVHDSNHHKYIYDTAIATVGDLNSRNIKVQMHYGIDTLIVNAYTDFTIDTVKVMRDVLMSNFFAANTVQVDTINNCERSILNTAIQQGKQDYKLFLDSMKKDLIGEFYSTVSNSVKEDMRIGYRDQRFNFTLYYYDRAGNLMRTVPPAGVQLIVDSSAIKIGATLGYLPNPEEFYTRHSKMSDYEYNSLDKVVQQKTPDAGVTSYFYDALGRVIYSQNEKQGLDGSFTYTLYDNQGRVTETGQANIGCKYFASFFDPVSRAMVTKSFPCKYYWGGMTSSLDPYVYNADAYSQEERARYIHTRVCTDVVRTIYDTISVDLASKSPTLDGQENLRKRVSSIQFFDSLAATDTFGVNYTYASHFSYDIAGNVKTLTHDYPALNAMKQRYKRIDYDYDLASGKVNMLSYNRGWGDQFYQLYEYDDDNRITKVKTSADGFIWKRDAEYQYYQHGPLARASIGDLRVQGVDFAYTIQGWLKAINGDLRAPLYDMGNDSLKNNVHAYDAMAMGIDYFKGDFKPIGDVGLNYVATTDKSLYNGNISRTVTDLLPFGGLVGNYNYDQLNRIKFANYDFVDPISAGIASLSATSKYKNNYSYDHDGNITQLVRYGDKSGSDMLMDSMNYYYPVFGRVNQLKQITDAANNNYTEDVRQYTDSQVVRYEYDKIGNVVKDLVSNQDSIHWNLYNKVVQTDNRGGRNNLYFTYDGMGNRVAKTFIQKTAAGNIESEKTEYYVRDAQGNILAVYNNDKSYSEFDEFPVITAVRDWVADIRTGLSTATFIDGFVLSVFGKDPRFLEAIKPTLTAHAALFPPDPTILYLLREPALTEKLLFHTTDWVNELNPFIQQNNFPHTMRGDAMAMTFAAGDNEFGTLLLNGFLGNPNLAKRKSVLEHVGTDIGSGIDLLRSAHDALTIAWDSSMDASGLAQNLIDSASADTIATALSTLFIDSSATVDFASFFNGVLGDYGLLVGDSYYDEQIPLMLQPVIGRYGDRGMLMQFFADRDSSYAELLRIEGADKLAFSAYLDAPFARLSAATSSFGYAFLDTAIFRTLGASPAADVFWDRVLTAATPDVITYIGTVDAFGPITFLSKRTTLLQDRYYLAEHHLYGSSRLGIKKYLSNQTYSKNNVRIPGGNTSPHMTQDSSVLNFTFPWYSLGLNEMIKNNERDPYGNFDIEKMSMSHILGQKQYELTNHLGNVQASISDKRYLGVNPPTYAGQQPIPPATGDTVVNYSPELFTAYDYYPFGQMMPGRNVSNVDTGWGTLAYTRNVHYNTLEPADSLDWTAGPRDTTGVPIVHYLVDGSLSLQFDSLHQSYWKSIPAVPGKRYSLELTSQVVSTGYMRAAIWEDAGSGIERELASAIIGTDGRYLMDFSTAPTLAGLKIIFTYHKPSHNHREIYSKFWVKYKKFDETDRPTEDVYVLTNVKDPYRFGFNGQEKVNEIYGRGTHYDFGARYYDARVGKLGFSLDPLFGSSPWQSPYSYANNSPIVYLDKEGKYGVLYTQVIDKKGNAVVYAAIDQDGYLTRSGKEVPAAWGNTQWDYVQFASIDLRTQKTTYSEKIATDYIPIWQQYGRKILSAAENYKPGSLKEKFDEYYSEGKGGISFTMTGGQGQEKNKVQFPDRNIVNLDDIFKFTGNYGGSGGMGFLSNWMDKLGNYNASMDMLDYMGGNNIYSLPDKEEVANDAKSSYESNYNNIPKIKWCKSHDGYVINGVATSEKPNDGEKVDTTSFEKDHK